jgi:hypothetical protein
MLEPDNAATGDDADRQRDEVTGARPLAPSVQATLGRALQDHYDDIVRTPIPDRFLVLLAELEAKEQGHERK